MTTPSAEEVSRTVLLSLHDHSQPTLEAAIAAHEQTALTIVADAAACASRAGQACLETAVACAVRAFGQVNTVLAGPTETMRGGLHSGQKLAATLQLHGAVVDYARVHPTGPSLLIGAQVPEPAPQTALVLRADWSAWTARVHNRAADTAQAAELDESCILAAIAAGALGVSEAFLWTRSEPGSDAGYRTIELNLWEPGGKDPGPILAHAPGAWWLVGLGHLGQANAWVLSWLPYGDPEQVEVVLQDIQSTTCGNHSTGLLVPRNSEPQQKTRLVAAALDRCHYTTRIVERRLSNRFTRDETDVHVALLGVDNLPTRRLTSTIGWHLAIDAGLGNALDYSSIVIRRFPGAARSEDIPAWQQAFTATLPCTEAFADLAKKIDTCGLAEIAGTAVGVVFVGVATACLVIAEAVRELHGGSGRDVLVCDLREPSDVRVAPGTERCAPVSLALM